MGMAPVHGRSRRAGHRGGQPRGGYSAAGDHHPQRPKKPLSVRPKPTTTSLVGTASPSIWPGVPPVRPRSSCDERRTVLQTYTFEVTGSPADLIVESVSVSDSSLTPRQSFTLSATVRIRAGVSLLRPPCAGTARRTRRSPPGTWKWAPTRWAPWRWTPPAPSRSD